MIIAIDGPAASGKGTLARMIAGAFGLPHLDTGLTYRAVAHRLLQQGEPLDDESRALAAARSIDMGALDRRVLADHSVGEAASRVAVMPCLREQLVSLQRDFANRPAGAVLDGRDIGTVVCPDADVKLYVTASAPVRATRRWLEIRERGQDAKRDAILADILARDARDMGRTDSPLKPASDAHIVDTSDMAIETAFDMARSVIEQVTGQKASRSS